MPTFTDKVQLLRTVFSAWKWALLYLIVTNIRDLYLVRSSIYHPSLASGLRSGRATSIIIEAAGVILSSDALNPFQNMVNRKIRNLFVVFLLLLLFRLFLLLSILLLLFLPFILLLTWYYSPVRFKTSRFPGARSLGSHTGDYEKSCLLACERRSYLLA